MDNVKYVKDPIEWATTRKIQYVYVCDDCYDEYCGDI